jgi:ADP-ribose pyrophosphatase
MIPKHAKQVFKGTIFEIYQWPQKMFDGSKKTFEMAKGMDGAGMIAIIKDKIIILKQQQPGTKWYFTLPGGYMDIPGETAKQCAIRELREETGMRAQSVKFWKKFIRGGRVEADLHMFVARDCYVVDEPKLDRGEKIQMELRSFEDFLKLADDDNFHHPRVIMEMLRARLSNKNKLAFRKLIFGK